MFVVRKLDDIIRFMKIGGIITLIGLLCLGLLVSRNTAQVANVLIAYEARGETNDDIWVTNLTGTIRYNLTQNQSRSWHPTWSGDGTQIAYTNNRDNDADIWVMDANGLNQRNLTNNPAVDVSPDWSRVADEIVFISTRDGGYDLYTVNVQTSEVTRLTDDGVAKSDPAWSPDGTQIAYWQSSGDDTQITILDVATGEKSIVVASGQNQWPTWSPDSQHLAYFNTAGDEVELYIVDIATGETRNITDNAAKDERPAWSADSTIIAFSSDRDGDYNIFIMDIDTGELMSVTDDAGNEFSPAWQPVRANIDFDANPALGQSVQDVVIRDIDPAEQEELGLGEIRTYAPFQVGLEDVFRIRLEVEVEPQIEIHRTGTPSPTPSRTPTATPTPSPTGIPLRQEADVNVYRFMGAELIGFDVGNFDILPQPTGYVLRIQEGEINYWEWRLRANSERAIRNNDLAIRLYLPQVQEDGTVIQSVIQTLDVSVEVVAGEAEVPSEYIEPQTVAAEDLQGFSVVYSNESAFYVIFGQTTSISTMTVANERDEIALARDFPDLGLFDFEVPEATCLYYDLQNAQLVLPRACEGEESTFNRTLNVSDIFWYDTRTRRLRDVIIRKDGQVFICRIDPESGRCDF